MVWLIGTLLILLVAGYIAGPFFLGFWGSKQLYSQTVQREIEHDIAQRLQALRQPREGHDAIR